MMAVEAKDKVLCWDQEGQGYAAVAGTHLANFAFGRVMHGRREMLHSNSRTHYIQGA